VAADVAAGAGAAETAATEVIAETAGKW